MRIFIDGIHVTPQMKGVGRYILNTLHQFRELDPSLDLVVSVLGEDMMPQLPSIEAVRWRRVQWRNHFWHGFRTIPQLVRESSPDVVWMPYETPIAPLPRPYAVLCHDVPQHIRRAQIEAHNPSPTFKEGLRNRVSDALMHGTLRRAGKVFSNSQYVANWLEHTVRVAPEHIRLAPCAPGADFLGMSRQVNLTEVHDKLEIADPYILAFYTGDPRENLQHIVEVYKSLASSEYDLVIAGVREHTLSEIGSTLSILSNQERVHLIPFLGAGHEVELAELYTAASLYLDLSLHEGFGMQVVEAMACGTPVVCSNRGALPEVAGLAAVLVNPENVTEIVAAVHNVLTSPSQQRMLRKCGYDRAASFTWVHTAQVIYDGLCEML